MKKIIIACILVFLQLINLSAQQTPTIIPPSPAAQAYMRYGEIPVNYSTGVPNIEIPIYTIEGKQLKVPISISYHASGIKVEDVATEVGLGWVLNYGGMISRTIFGLPDEKIPSHAFDSASVLINSAQTASNHFDISCGCLQGIYDFEYSLTLAEDNQDYMSDRFSYNLPSGISGVFRYDYTNSDNVIKLPNRPLKIEKTVSGTNLSNRKIDRFKITDENGTVYLFEPLYANTGPYCTEWYLKQMISADGSDNIQFNYTSQSAISSVNPTMSMVLTNAATGAENCPISGIDNSNMAQHWSYSNVSVSPVLQSIVSSSAVVQFTYSSDRADFNQLRRLTDIKISPINSTTVIKSIHFNNINFGSVAENNIRLGLDNVVISAANNPQPQIYSFTYENQRLPPYPSKMGSYPKFHEDFWGYYNGGSDDSAGATSMMPSDFITNSSDRGTFGANRHADLSSSRACMLKEIKYPTGGRTVFHFGRFFAENIYPNAYGNSPAGYYGGFRVDSITNYTENDKVGVKTYNYSNSNIKQILSNLFGYNLQYYGNGGYPANEMTGSPATSCWSTYQRYLNFSDPVLPLEVGVGMPIMYTKVEEYNGTATNNTGKTVYEYAQSYSPSNFETNPEHYQSTYESMHSQPQYYHPFHYDKGNYTPELITKTQYSSNGNLVSVVNNVYENLYSKEFLTGIKLTRDIQYPLSFFQISYAKLISGNTFGTWTEPEGLAATQQIRDTYLSSIVAIDTKAYQQAPLLASTENYTYDPSDPSKYVVSTTNFEYDPEYLQLTKQTTSTSVSGKNKITQFTYPFNYTTAPYPTMVLQNNVAPVIEQSEYTGTTFLQAKRNNYGFFQSNAIIAPSSLDMKTGSNDYETRLVYGAYDNIGNLQYVTKDNATKIIYLWSYNKQYPIAKIEGLTYSQLLIYYPQTSIDNLANTTSPTVDQLNAIRTTLASQSALVTTYTYNPLVGMVTATDPRGVTTNYTYDTFNRLYLARNDDKNIVGRYRYGYQNAPDNGLGGYGSLTGTVNIGAASYSLGATGTASLANVSGGTGSYTYNWYLTDNSGTVLSSALNTSVTSYSFTCSSAGYLSVKCVITDNATGTSNTVYSPTITVTSATLGYITTSSNFNWSTQNVSITGTTVSVDLSFSPSMDMTTGTTYTLGVISANCRPSAARTVTVQTSDYKINFYIGTDGALTCLILNCWMSPGFFPQYDSVNFSFTYNK